MRQRRGWKRGEWLVRDEESGLVEYGSNVIRDYYGVLKRKDQADHIHPQQFVRAKEDPYMQYPQANPAYVYDVSSYDVSAFVYGTTIPAPIGPATHLFNPSVLTPPVSDTAIPNMTIGSDFIVR